MLVNPDIETTATLWPNSEELKDSLSFPMSIATHPLGNDCSRSGIKSTSIKQIRCQSCRGFLNPICFVRSQHEWDCALCGCTNRMTSAIDMGSVELNHMTYTLKAPSRQRVLRTEQRLAVFVLDLAIHCNEAKEFLLNATALIRQFARRVANQRLPFKIMLVGYDSKIYRFGINPPEGQQASVSISTGYDPKDQDYLLSNEELRGSPREVLEHIEAILDHIEEMIREEEVGKCKSEAMLDTIGWLLQSCQGWSGKVWLISGVTQPLAYFKEKLSSFFYDIATQRSYLTNRQNCISPQLQALLQHTQMSLSFLFFKSTYANIMPFHHMAKTTNGQLRHFLPKQATLFFHQLRQQLQEFVQPTTGYEALLKVRTSTGLRLVGTFGLYRETKIPDQIDLLTCPASRQLLFEFGIQGRINSLFVVVQLSTLYTTVDGQRHFVIETHLNKVSADPINILNSIDYTSVNVAYVRGISHKLDEVKNSRQLQVALQERCRQHLKSMSQLGEQVAPGLRKRAKSYLIMTFLMMKHFLLNMSYNNALHCDMNTEMRNKIATHSNCEQIVWPVVYAMSEEGWEIVEMQEKHLVKGTVGIVVDRGDQFYCSLTDPKYHPHLSVPQAQQQLIKLVERDEQLSPIRRLLEQIRERKGLQHVEVLPLGNLSELGVLNMEGIYGYGSFISQMAKK